MKARLSSATFRARRNALAILPSSDVAIVSPASRHVGPCVQEISILNSGSCGRAFLARQLNWQLQQRHSRRVR
jgi:hypothetical protein